jgi:hypothetical protein
VHHVGHLPRSLHDARSTKYKIVLVVAKPADKIKVDLKDRRRA